MEFLEKSLKPHIERIDAIIHEAFQSDVRLIRAIGDHLSLPGGKRIRPAMTVLAAQACGRPIDQDLLNVAAGVEVFHMATLLHDDVIDNATQRRGRTSVNAQWSDNAAILMADYLFARAFDLTLAAANSRILSLLCQVTRQMVEGEMLQIEREGRLMTREEYFGIIERKTAALFSACAQIGGMVAKAEPAVVASLGQFGLNFGMAFQITDDTLDFAAESRNWGKPVGGDIANGKQTLPLIYALETATREDRASLLKLLSNGRDFSRILEHVRKYNGLDHARQVARDFADRATRCLDGWTAQGTSERFLELCSYVVNRAY
ncbi:MAG: Octaprenyl-diphosphate synthase [candidate division BRC1 bacterium ADurb.BinA364]|nr:MAG: Octaprenyl-diphosphate synthase [candidate division BRC1 bacterium ADurb.BinA364]